MYIGSISLIVLYQKKFIICFSSVCISEYCDGGMVMVRYIDLYVKNTTLK